MAVKGSPPIAPKAARRVIIYSLRLIIPTFNAQRVRALRQISVGEPTRLAVCSCSSRTDTASRIEADQGAPLAAHPHLEFPDR
jgi:hypothetical protein